MTERWAVKVRRTFEGREFTSVLYLADSKREAEFALSAYTEGYQSDQYYIERWIA